MSAIGVDLLWDVWLIPGCRNYQQFGRRGRCPCYLSVFPFPMGGLQALGRVSCLDVLRVLLVQQLSSTLDERRWLRFGPSVRLRRLFGLRGRSRRECMGVALG
ncbi:hypothetical protein L3X38_004529 [Prunus dulcis]|uniref:Uncharacterized protein n=1 Tax=Prunus dulcis TaxID=3755 RepID=A0AAD4ZP28_PRUDU|nr:hypothetical protein L3X38_004529 [Prunus dulcis]